MSDRASVLPAGSHGLTLRQTQWVLLGVLVVGLGWRCCGLVNRSLWYDEAKIFFVSRFPLADLFNRLHYDVDAPLYYLILKAWRAGRTPSPLSLRVPSVVFGTLTILGAYLFTVEALRSPSGPDDIRPLPPARARETGLWAAALVALSVFQIRWSWEINKYALGAALAVWSSWALFRALHRTSGSYGFWLLYTVLALVFAWTDYLGLFTIAAQWLFVVGCLVVQARAELVTCPAAKTQPGSLLWLIRHPQFELAVRSLFVFGLGFFVWLHFFHGQLEQVQNAAWMPSPGWMTAGCYTYHAMVDPEGFPPQAAVPLVILCAVFCVAVPVALVWKARAPQWFVLLAMVLPFGLCLAAATWFDLPLFFSRYFLFAHLFLLIGAALLIGRVPVAWTRLAIGGVLLLSMTAADVLYVRELDQTNHPSYQGAVAYIESHRSPYEPVVVCDQVAYLPMLYYVQTSEPLGQLVLSLRPANEFWYMFGSHPDVEYDDWVAMGADNVMHSEQLAEITRGRIWVVNTAPMRFHFSSDESTCDVPVPANWAVRSTETFDDVYGVKRTLKIVEYEVVPPAEVKK
jgi:hypothetical protein